MSTFADDLADGEYALVVEALLELRKVKVQAWRTSREYAATQRLTRADFGIERIDAVLKKLDIDAPTDAVPAEGAAVRVGIRVEGGAIQNVFAEQATQVYVIDYDVEDAAPADGREEPDHGVCDLEQDGGSIEACVLRRYSAEVAPKWFPRMDQSLASLAERLQEPDAVEGMTP